MKNTAKISDLHGGECYTPDDIQEILNLSRSGVYNLFQAKSFPTLRIGKCLRVRRTAFETWCIEREQEHMSGARR